MGVCSISGPHTGLFLPELMNAASGNGDAHSFQDTDAGILRDPDIFHLIIDFSESYMPLTVRDIPAVATQIPGRG